MSGKDGTTHWRAPVGLWIAFGLTAILMTACATVDESDVVRPKGQVAVSPALQDPAQHLLKRKVVIARFSNETPYGKSVLLGEKKSMIGSMASDTLSTKLTETGQFLLFERSDPEDVMAAFERNELASLKLPADYLIIGSLSEFGRNTTGETGFLSRTKVQTAYARVNVRLIDVKTGQVVFSQEGAGEAQNEAGEIMGVGTKAGYDATLDSKAINAAISKLVSNLTENLLSQPWRSFVLSREGDNLVISGGQSQGIRVGDRFVLVKRGKTVANPQTGLEMELPGTNVATLEVVSLFGSSPLSEGSICKVVSGSAPGGDFTDYRVEEVTQ